ncbi:MAG: TfoX/Sxy family protein [Rubellimicrobium sp.]|nr:TfoX/Sxy family protein [Rubellimicrobium sp.]
MATRPETVALITETLPGTVARAMFGEYALYLDGRVIALICDDSLFLRNLPEAAAILAGATLARPYPGARPHLLADSWLDDAETLRSAARALAGALPPPEPRRKRGKPARAPSGGKAP